MNIHRALSGDEAEAIYGGFTEVHGDPLRRDTLEMLTSFRVRLECAIDGCPEINSHMARRYLAKVKSALDQPHHWQAWRGTFGPNGIGPGIEDAIKSAWFWKDRRLPSPDNQPSEVGR